MSFWAICCNIYTFILYEQKIIYYIYVVWMFACYNLKNYWV